MKRLPLSLSAFLALLALSAAVQYASAAPKKSAAGKRKSARAGSGGKKARSSARGSSASNASASAPSPDQSYIASAQLDQPQKSKINEDNCEFYYNLCMNEVCSDADVGKCSCYEDNRFNNWSAQEPQYREIGGSKYKFGFDLLGAAKRKCGQVVDNCMENRRNITQKYETAVRRDCLKISEVMGAEDQGIRADVNNLKDCMRDFCTVYLAEDYPDFNTPEFSLCFKESYANYIRESFCQETLANAPAPGTMLELLNSELDWKREQSCKRMNGQISGDRKHCYLTVNYGKNKDEIWASRKAEVGSYLSCKAGNFGITLQETDEYKKEQKHAKMQMAAAGIRMGSGIAATAMGGSWIAAVVEQGIDIGAQGANWAVDEKKIKEAEAKGDNATAEALKSQRVGNAISLGMSVFAVGQTTVGGVKSVKSLAADGKSGVKKFTAGGNGLSAGTLVKSLGSALQIGGMALDMHLTRQIDNQSREMAEMGMNSSMVSREGGATMQEYGLVQDGGNATIHGQVSCATSQQGNCITEHGNCFINNEWFATEDEVLLLQWTM